MISNKVIKKLCISTYPKSSTSSNRQQFYMLLQPRIKSAHEPTINTNYFTGVYLTVKLYILSTKAIYKIQIITDLLLFETLNWVYKCRLSWQASCKLCYANWYVFTQLVTRGGIIKFNYLYDIGRTSLSTRYFLSKQDILQHVILAARMFSKDWRDRVLLICWT